MTDDNDLPKWERQPHLTAYAREVLRAYLDQDPPRKLLDAYNLVRERKGKSSARRVSSGMYNRINGRNENGVKYPGAMTLAEIEREHEDYLARLEREKWVERRLKIREQEWEVGQALLQRGQEMLLFPVMAQETSKDGAVMIIRPADWRLKDIPTVLEKASKLMRLGAGMPTDSVVIDWRKEAEREGLNPDEIINAAIAKFREGMESVDRPDDERGMDDSTESSESQD